MVRTHSSSLIRNSVPKRVDQQLTGFELYNLNTDPQETTELSAAHPSKLAEMQTALVNLNTEVEAESPDGLMSEDRATKNTDKKKKKQTK